jgi:glycosyltransferase involved in cell wall biosynthesis
VEKRGNNELRSALGLQNAFVVLYAGNIGRTHGLETLIGAAEKLRDSPEIQFLIIGSGARKDWMEQEKQIRRLTNVHFQPNQPRSRQTAFLNACDIGIISYASGMSGVSVPSRMYNLFASGNPVIAVADRDSERALGVQEEQIGWVVPPSSPEALVAALREAQASDPDLLRDLGMRARKMVESKYTLERTVRGYVTLVQELRGAESR